MGAPVEIHTLAWEGDQAATDKDASTVSLLCKVFVDGRRLPGVIRARTRHDADGFAITTITLAAPTEIVRHTHETWLELE